MIDEPDSYAVELQGRWWRVVSDRADDMSAPPREKQGHGRFDDPMILAETDRGGYAVLYAAVHPRTAFLEVLPQFRSQLEDLRAFAQHIVLDIEERDLLMEPTGGVPRSWIRHSRLVSAKLRTDAPLFDLANPRTLQQLRAQLAPSLVAMGLDDLDFGHVLGSDRVLTGAIGRWVWSHMDESGRPSFSGIRYRSRWDPDALCVALYNNRFHADGEVRIEKIGFETSGFEEAMETLRLAAAT